MQELSDAYVAGAKRYQSGQVKGRNERAISDEALQGYINYMFGQCLTSEEEVQAEMTSFDDEMGKTRPEYTAEVAHCHMECKRIPGLEKIRQPVVSARGVARCLNVLSAGLSLTRAFLPAPPRALPAFAPWQPQHGRIPRKRLRSLEGGSLELLETRVPCRAALTYDSGGIVQTGGG